MIYIISGASRSGKTKVAKKLLNKYKLPYLSLDYLMMGFTHGVPEMGIHDKLWANEIAEKMWKFLEPFIVTIIHSGEDYVLEGEAILPELIQPLIDKYQDHVRICFMGYQSTLLNEKVSNIIEYASDEDWLINLGHNEIESHVKNMINYSNMIMKEAKQYNMPYVDTSKDFTEGIESVIRVLMRDEK